MKTRKLFLLFFAILLATGVDSQVKDSSFKISSSKLTSIERNLALARQNYQNQKTLDIAIISLDSILELATDPTTEVQRAEALLLRGKMELSSYGPRDHPTRHILESLSIYNRLEVDSGIVQCNLQLGVLNYGLQNYSAAVTYLNNIIEIGPAGEYKYGITYYLLALCHSELGKYELAIEMFEKAPIAMEIAYPSFLLQLETFRGKMYINQGNYKKAIDHLNALILEYSELIKTNNYSPVYAFLSTAYLKNKNYDKAIYFARIAYQRSVGKDNYLIYVQEAEENLSKAFHALGNNDSAYYYLEALTIMKDSQSNNQIIQRVAKLKSQYEIDKMLDDQKVKQDLKDAEVKRKIDQERLIRNSLLGAFIIALIVAILFLNQRNKLSKEKNRSDSLLLNILPASIAEELKDKGYAEAKDYKMVSVLFTDFVEFTQASEKLSAEELVKEVNTCFGAFDVITEKYEIEKIKTIGDAYLAAGGIPIPTEKSAKNTILAALEMQEFLARRKIEKNLLNELAFEMRVGIHTGPLVAGIVGIKKFQYDIWGDTVNTASRLESNGQAGKINISQTTYQLLKDMDEFRFESRGKIKAKGKGEIDMWFVERNNFKTS